MSAGGFELDASRFLELSELVLPSLPLPSFLIQASLVSNFSQHIDSLLGWSIANRSASGLYHLMNIEIPMLKQS